MGSSCITFTMISHVHFQRFDSHTASLFKICSKKYALFLTAPGNPNVVDDTVIALAKSCPLLTRINVSGCRELTDVACTAGLAAHGHRFVRVGLARCNKLTDAGMQALASSAQGLHSLDVGFCDRITDVGVASVARKCPQLRWLDLTCCIQVTSAALVVLSGHARELRVLSVRGCTHVSDAGLAAVAAGCPFLADLNVWMCPLVTDDGVGSVIRRCPLLQSLAVCGCALVTDVTADLVAGLPGSALIDVAYADASLTAGGRVRLERRLSHNRVQTGAGKTGGAAFHPSSLLRN
jgi:F-box/leucine-rich repeat protein 2/20